ncbi:MAG: long-chain fatty acid--CoA ligase [Candidatus Eremiobacteraeota bacterium]|nr:long-chain fatty acid--CoA ligase [Candidatus Eremiobacteraeota bacterium]
MQTLPGMLADALKTPRERAFGERLGAPDWRYTSSTRMLDRAHGIAAAIRAAGIEGGQRIALIANNRVDWLAADFGILFAGCVVVPTFATMATDQIDYIFEDSETRLAFVETAEIAARLKAACPHAPRFVHFDGDGPDSLATFEASGAMAAADSSRIKSFYENVNPDDLAVLMYTSGTTGTPKGVMLTHANLVTDSYEAYKYGFSDILHDDPVISVLPFAHIYEHTDVLGFIQFGCSIHITQPEFFLDDVRSVRPLTMGLVPRIYERVLAAVIAKAKADGGLKAELVPWALGVGRDYMTAIADGKNLSFLVKIKYAVAQRLALSKIKPALGLDRVHVLVSGSAPLHRDIALTFAGFGVPICEGYGLTETSPVVSVNVQRSIRYGSVGKPIPTVSVKIADDGEILVKGPNVMKGYYHLPGEQPFTTDGWFMTGDIGRLDADGYLYVTDRKKELIKTSGGKFVAPARVEAAIKRSIYVGQVFVLGDGRPHPIALVAPNWELIRRDFSIGAEVASEQIAARGDVCDFLQREVAANTADLATFEQVRKIAVLPRDLTIEAGELSPTLKVKRRVVEREFAALVDAAYAQASAA